MLHVPTFSGANVDVPNYGYNHGFIRTITRLGGDATAGVAFVINRDASRGVVRPSLTIYGAASADPPDPGTYVPMPPALGLFFAVPYNQTGPTTYTSALRARMRSPTGSSGISVSASPNNTWVDPAQSALSWYADTVSFAGSVSVLLDLAFSGNTGNYQTYLIRNTFTA